MSNIKVELVSTLTFGNGLGSADMIGTSFVHFVEFTKK